MSVRIPSCWVELLIRTKNSRSREEALSDIVAIQLVSTGLHVKDGSSEDEEELSR